MVWVPLRAVDRFSRLHPVRRMTSEECDLVGYAGPLVLSARQVRWIFGPWRTTGYTVSHHRRGVLMQVSKAELLDLGLHLDPDTLRNLGGTRR